MGREVGGRVKKMIISHKNIILPQQLALIFSFLYGSKLPWCKKKHYGFYTGLGQDLGYRSSSITH